MDLTANPELNCCVLYLGIRIQVRIFEYPLQYFKYRFSYTNSENMISPVKNEGLLNIINDSGHEKSKSGPCGKNSKTSSWQWMLRELMIKRNDLRTLVNINQQITNKSWSKMSRHIFLCNCIYLLCRDLRFAYHIARSNGNLSYFIWHNGEN